jgi:hypothetical protein
VIFTPTDSGEEPTFILYLIAEYPTIHDAALALAQKDLNFDPQKIDTDASQYLIRSYYLLKRDTLSIESFFVRLKPYFEAVDKSSSPEKHIHNLQAILWDYLYDKRKQPQFDAVQFWDQAFKATTAHTGKYASRLQSFMIYILKIDAYLSEEPSFPELDSIFFITTR